jgi:hypothetical protein
VKGDRVPPTDHIARLCYGKGVDDGQILGAAFLPRPTDNYLSVNWLEILNCPDRLFEIAEFRIRYAAIPFNLKKKDLIAILNVGDMCTNVEEESQGGYHLRVTHEPTEADDSHSGVWGFSENNGNNLLIAELICSTVLETYPAVETL